MAKKFLTPIDMTGNEIQNVLAQIIAGNPGAPVAGQFWYNSTTNRWMYRDNAANIDPRDRAVHSGTQVASTISDLATVVQAYRLDQFAVPTADINLNTHKLINVVDPAGAQDAATKAYVDNLVNGLDWKPSVRVATTAAGTLATSFANGQTVDGVVIATGNRLLIKNQAAGAENGLYTVNASGAPTRTTDADANAEVTPGMAVFVEEGTANGNQQWVLTTDAPIVLGTTALTFAQTGAQGTSPTAGAGLTLTSNTYDVVAGAAPASGGPGGGLVVAADSIAIDTAVVVRKFAVSIGDGSALAYTVTHNLNTQDVMIAIYDTVTPFAEVQADVEHTTVNTAIIRFSVAPTTNKYRVVVQA